MNQVAGTMPEFRLRTTGKKVQAAVSHSAVSRQRQVVAAAASADSAKKAAARSKGKPGAAIAAWWPVGVGLFLCGFVVDWHTMAQQAGVWFERLLFPLTLLAQHGSIGVSAQTALYLQLPLEGLVAKLVMDRRRGLKAAISLLIVMHGTAALVLWLVSFGK